MKKRVKRFLKKYLKKYFEFSKLLIAQESVLVWISTFKLLDLATESVSSGYMGTLPYLATLCGAIWAAYGVSQGFYYNKSKSENVNKHSRIPQIPEERFDEDCDAE